MEAERAYIKENRIVCSAEAVAVGVAAAIAAVVLFYVGEILTGSRAVVSE